MVGALLILITASLVLNHHYTNTPVIKWHEPVNRFRQSDGGSIVLHSGIVEKKELLLSKLLLCRDEMLFIDDGRLLNTSQPLFINNWTTDKCLDDDGVLLNKHVRRVTSIQAEEADWVSCAQQVDQTALEVQKKIDWIFLSCPSYPMPKDPVVLLENSIRRYDPNIFHLLVVDSESHCGKGFWCLLDAATRFRQEALLTNTTTWWRMEFQVDPGKSTSTYAQQLFQLLGNDGDECENTTVVPYKLGELAPKLRHGTISDSRYFRPNTRPNDFLIDIAARVRHAIVVPHSTSRPFVLLVLRSTSSRRLAGTRTGTATEIVLALLRCSLPLRIIDLSFAPVVDQIEWFSQALVVIGMHGAGLTNLVWMKKGSTVIEIAAGYGWARYVDENGTCHQSDNESVKYKKADYFNLAKRFRIKHNLIHPVYAIPQRPGRDANPIHKSMFYVDADSVALATQNAFFDT